MWFEMSSLDSWMSLTVLKGSVLGKPSWEGLAGDHPADAEHLCTTPGFHWLLDLSLRVNAKMEPWLCEMQLQQVRSPTGASCSKEQKNIISLCFLIPVLDSCTCRSVLWRKTAAL